MLQMHGRVKSVNTTPRPDGKGGTFDSTTIVVEGWGNTYYVEPTRDFGPTPEVGDEVAMEVTPRPYNRKDGSAGVGWRGVALVRSPARAAG
ncbi:hypothetical protein [Nocardioides sp. LML1-1-1.1]|uniref:hypothetical protein n=1 Tax=Nocardioides sp. LML1-1-1.1 TaxID=3135248 RepID=UPI00342BC9ED